MCVLSVCAFYDYVDIASGYLLLMHQVSYHHNASYYNKLHAVIALLHLSGAWISVMKDVVLHLRHHMRRSLFYSYIKLYWWGEDMLN